MRLGSLFAEIHRRSVWQTLGSYALVAWIILQLVETLEGLIGLPLWFGPAIVVVVLLGFPVLLITTLTQGGWREDGIGQTHYRDSAGGGDESLSSWRSLDGHPVRDALRQIFTWRNAIVGGAVVGTVLVIGTAGYSGMRSAGIGPLGSLVAKGVFEANEDLILSDFEDRTSDGTLGETVTALFRIDLSQSTSLHLLERPELSPALVRMQREPTAPVTLDVALELAQREGVKGVVAGEVLPLGHGAVVSARLVASGSGEILVALRETARTIDAVPDAVDRLSAQLRERIGESLLSIQGDPPLEEVTTGSLEALRKYVQAEWAADMGDVSTAEALVKEAIVLDPAFSMAHRKLGVILSNDSRNEEEARDAFTKAFQGRNRLPDRERLLAEAAYHTYVTEDLDSAVQAYEGVLALYPADGIAGNNLAVLYGERDEMDKAADLYIQAIERGHAPAVSYTNAAFTLYGIDRADSAAAILSSFRQVYPGHPQVLQYSAALSSAQHAYEGAEASVNELMETQAGNARWEMWGEAELANYALIKGKLNEGASRILRAHDLQEAAGTPFNEMSRPAFEAFGTASLQLHFLQDPEGAVHTLDQVAPGNPSGVVGGGGADGGETSTYAPEMEFAVLYAQAGRTDRARQQLQVAQLRVTEGEAGDEGRRARVLFGEAAIELAEGNALESIRLYREGRTLVPKCQLCGLAEMGEAFEAAAMPDSAVSAYEEFLETRTFFRSQFDNVGLHRVLLGLARSYEGLGLPQEAGVHYRRVLTLWADADPGLQPRVEELRRKLSALEDGTP